MTQVADTVCALFPKIPSYGFTVNPRYLVKITQREGGYERRDRKWNRPLLSYTSVPLETVTPADWDAALNFYHAMGGTASGFRFRDQSDFRSCGSDFTVAPTLIDQPFYALPTTGTYQMSKTYQVAIVGGTPIVQIRDIIKPVSTGLLIGFNGVTADPGTYSLHLGTGILTGPTGTWTWGGLFDTYVRFAGDLNLNMNDYGVIDFTMTLQELRAES